MYSSGGLYCYCLFSILFFLHCILRSWKRHIDGGMGPGGYLPTQNLYF